MTKDRIAHEGMLREVKARIERYLTNGQEHDLEMVEDAMAMHFLSARPVEALLIWSDVQRDPERYGPAGWSIVDRALASKPEPPRVADADYAYPLSPEERKP